MQIDDERSQRYFSAAGVHNSTTLVIMVDVASFEVYYTCTLNMLLLTLVVVYS